MKAHYSAYLDEDVTDVYSAILSTRTEDIARSLFQEGKAKPNPNDSFINERLIVAESRVNSIKNLIRALQPDINQSGQAPILPWMPSDVSRIRGKNWSGILGMRIVIPCKTSKKQKAGMIANLLTDMTRIQ